MAMTAPGIWGHLAARCPHRLLEEDLQGSPGTAAQIGKKLPAIQEISTQNLRDAEYEMPVRNLLEHIHTEPFPEFQNALLMAGWAEMPAAAGECQERFMAAVFASHSGTYLQEKVNPF
jgi:hypothetical protein